MPQNVITILTEEDAQKINKIAHIAELVRTGRQGGKRLSEMSANAQRFIRARLDELGRDFTETTEESGESLDDSRTEVAAS